MNCDRSYKLAILAVFISLASALLQLNNAVSQGRRMRELLEILQSLEVQSRDWDSESHGRSYPRDRPVPRIDRETDHRVYYRPQAP